MHSQCVVVAQWCPSQGMPHFWLPVSQLFGGRATPQNFARFPAWLCALAAILYAVPVQHCVDDMIGMDRLECVASGWEAWRHLADVTGWDVPDAKSPPPSQVYTAVGYVVIHIGTPSTCARLQITEERIDTLCAYISIALGSCRLTGGEADSLFGHLGFALNATQGLVRSRAAPPSQKKAAREES